MTGEIHVFVGPSLSRAARPTMDDIVFHPPAAQGDIYSLVASRPFAIGVIDGYFEWVPAVWHKEVLWALSEGVHMFGGASMGALRAVELCDFGMVGVGRIFDDFRSGVLQDDDEVTLVHADADADYRPGSEPMVNIRATLASAEGAGLLSPLERDRLVAHAKGTFYADRCYPDLLGFAEKVLGVECAQRLGSWLKRPENRVDLKRLDALELLQRLLELREQSPGRKRVNWAFHHTDAWEQVRRTFPPRDSTTSVGAVTDTTRRELEIIRADPEHHAELRTLANLRAARAELARRDGFCPSAADITRQASELAQRNGIRDAVELRAWMAERGVDAAELERLLADEARAVNAELVRASNENLALLDYLQTRSQPPPRITDDVDRTAGRNNFVGLPANKRAAENCVAD